MELNKKGVFYLFVALIFLSVVGTALFFSSHYELREKQEVVNTRIRAMNDFVDDLNNDAKKATFIAGYRALIAMEEEIAQKGMYLTDAELVFEEAFYNGTVGGANKTILNASSFSDYLTRLGVNAAKTGMSLDIQVESVGLSQTNPWYVDVKVNFTNNVTDLRGLASWYYQVEQTTRIPIIDLRDPVYSVGTLGRLPNTIQITNYSFFINDVANANDTTNLMAHTTESFYIASESAPSYTMRLEGNFSNSTNGIESLIYIPDLEDQGFTIDNSKSIVAYLYFNANLTNASPLCHTMMNAPVWFRIDRYHLKIYEVDPKLDPENIGYLCNG